jgi:hypothetical protein
VQHDSRATSFLNVWQASAKQRRRGREIEKIVRRMTGVRAGERLQEPIVGRGIVELVLEAGGPRSSHSHRISSVVTVPNAWRSRLTFLPVRVCGHPVAAEADDGKAFRKQAVPVEVVQGGQQLPLRQVTVAPNRTPSCPDNPRMSSDVISVTICSRPRKRS